jgi:hypothetical protein
MPAAPANYEQQLLEQALYVLKEKFSKPYPPGTWLIVYFNPTMFTPGWTASPKTETLGFATKILTKGARMLAKPQRITNVWVLTNDGRIREILS